MRKVVIANALVEQIIKDMVTGMHTHSGFFEFQQVLCTAHDEYNKLYFNSSLPTPVFWVYANHAQAVEKILSDYPDSSVPKEVSGASYKKGNKHVFVFGPALFLKDLNKVRELFLHEMCHQAVRCHPVAEEDIEELSKEPHENKYFRRWAQVTHIPVKAFLHEGTIE